MGQLGRTSAGSTQYQAPRTKLTRIAAEKSKTVYTLKDSLLEKIKEALFTNLKA